MACIRIILIAAACLMGIAGAQLSAPKKERTADEKRIFLEDQARASRLSHSIAAERERKRDALLQRFRIKPAADSCLAYNRSAEACAVSIGEFNGAVGSYLPDSLEGLPESQYPALALRTRGLVLDILLDKAYLQDLQAMGKVALAPERDPREDGEGPQADTAPDARFRECFPALLAADPDFRVKVLASTDSVFLDSLLFRSGTERPAPGTLAPGSLPPEAARDLIGLRPGSWSRIRKVPFGYLALSPSKRPPDPARSRRLLSLLANPPPADSGRQAQARKYYRDHPGEFTAMDTLDLRVRLIPKPKGYRTTGDPARGGAETAALPAGIASRAELRMASTALPTAVERWLGEARRDSLGPVRLEYGLWSFVVLGRKQGRGLLTFAEAGPSLDARLDAQSAEARLREALSGARSKSESANLERIRSALVREREETGAMESADRDFTRGKRAWIAENIRMPYKLEE